jgi:hypothetical protein
MHFHLIQPAIFDMQRIITQDTAGALQLKIETSGKEYSFYYSPDHGKLPDN